MTSWNLISHVCETSKFVMAILRWKQGLLCNKLLSVSKHSWRILPFWIDIGVSGLLFSYGRILDCSELRQNRWQINSYQKTKFKTSKFKAFAENKINVENWNLFGNNRKHGGKRRRCWLPASLGGFVAGVSVGKWNPGKTWIMWTVAEIWLKYCWKRRKPPFKSNHSVGKILHLPRLALL